MVVAIRSRRVARSGAVPNHTREARCYMPDEIKKGASWVGETVGMVICVILVGIVVRLFGEVIGQFIPIEWVYLVIVAVVLLAVALIWYRNYRRDQRWIRENQDLITGQRSRRSRPTDQE